MEHELNDILLKLEQIKIEEGARYADRIQDILI